MAFAGGKNSPPSAPFLRPQSCSPLILSADSRILKKRGTLPWIVAPKKGDNTPAMVVRGTSETAAT